MATLVIHGVSKSLFAYSILTEVKPKDFTLLIFKIFKGNSDPGGTYLPVPIEDGFGK